MPRIAASDVETVLNVQLARLLQGQGLDASPEHRQPGSSKQIDVQITVDSAVVALEAKIDDRAAALNHAADRLEQHDAGDCIADEAVAVVYEPGLTARDFNESTDLSWDVAPDGRV